MEKCKEWRSKENELSQNERLGLAWCRLNGWEWDDYIGSRPDGFDDMPRESKRTIKNFFRKKPCKGDFVSQAMKNIELMIGEAETSRCWWKFVLNRTDEEWRKWYLTKCHNYFD